MESLKISPEQVLRWLQARQNPRVFVDVRSPKEYELGHIPGFSSAPILEDDERHQVGLAYRKQGQKAAIQRGHDLVPKEQRVARWQELIGEGPAVLACWRGGLRSQIAQSWLKSAATSVQIVEGGYKAMRNLLLKRMEHLPQLWILSGLTGSGKTELLSRLTVPVVDLEGRARHRGSAFGSFDHHPQPAQQSFENGVLLDFPGPDKACVLEDESAHIGRLSIPAPLFQAMQAAPVIILETPLAQRVHHIFTEYVAQPLRQGMPPEQLQQSLSDRLDRVVRRLGGKRHATIREQLQAGFRANPHASESHVDWIRSLLVEYYDPQYHYGFNRRPREVVFKGDRLACQQWIQHHLHSPSLDKPGTSPREVASNASLRSP